MTRHRSSSQFHVGAGAGALIASTLVGIGVVRTATVTKDVLYVPTPPQVVDEMLEVAGLGRGERLIDLGSGDGRIVVGAAKRGASAVGIEIDPALVETARNAAAQAGVGALAQFREANIFDVDLGDADVITMYLLPSLNMRLRPRLLDLKPGTRIVTHAFDMEDWRPDRRVGRPGHVVYLWIVPARVAGTWQLEREGRRIRLHLRQQFQDVGGSALVGEQTVPVENAALRGAELRFTLRLDGREEAFHGSIDGGRLLLDPPWRASRAELAQLR